VVLAHLVLSEDGWCERKAERDERGRQAEADTGRGGHGMVVLWVGFSEATSAASPTTMPRPGLLPAGPKILPLSRIVEAGKLMAANALRVPGLDVLLTELSANGCSRVCTAGYQALVRGLESGLAVACRLDLSHSLELSD